MTTSSETVHKKMVLKDFRKITSQFFFFNKVSLLVPPLLKLDTFVRLRQGYFGQKYFILLSSLIGIDTTNT
jgi:hypothetical protein